MQCTDTFHSFYCAEHHILKLKKSGWPVWVKNDLVWPFRQITELLLVSEFTDKSDGWVFPSQS